MLKAKPTKSPFSLNADKPVAPRYSKRYPRGYWNDVTNQRTFLDKLGKELSITNKEWYTMTYRKFAATLSRYGGYGLLSKYKSPSKLFTTLFPEYKTECSNFLYLVS